MRQNILNRGNLSKITWSEQIVDLVLTSLSFYFGVLPLISVALCCIFTM